MNRFTLNEAIDFDFFEKMLDKFVDYLPTLLTALAIFIIGSLINKAMQSLTMKALGKSRLDKTVHGFIKSAVHIVILAFTIIIALSTLGIPMTSIIAAVSAAGLAIGLALQGSLSNVAGGFIVLFSKPFKAGDYISVAGVEGTVEEITILSTKITTVDNKAIYVPNGTVSGSTIVNFSREPLRRVDLSFGISYDDDYHKAIKIIENVISKHEKALKDPAPTVRVGELGASSVNITTRIWTNSADYWDVYFDIIEQVKTAFDENDITFPYNQIYVHGISKSDK